MTDLLRSAETKTAKNGKWRTTTLYSVLKQKRSYHSEQGQPSSINRGGQHHTGKASVDALVSSALDVPFLIKSLKPCRTLVRMGFIAAQPIFWLLVNPLIHFMGRMPFYTRRGRSYLSFRLSEKPLLAETYHCCLASLYR